MLRARIFRFRFRSIKNLLELNKNWQIQKKGKCICAFQFEGDQCQYKTELRMKKLMPFNHTWWVAFQPNKDDLLVAIDHNSTIVTINLVTSEVKTILSSSTDGLLFPPSQLMNDRTLILPVADKNRIDLLDVGLNLYGFLTNFKSTNL